MRRERSSVEGSSGHNAASGTTGQWEHVSCTLLSQKSVLRGVTVGHREEGLFCAGELEHPACPSTPGSRGASLWGRRRAGKRRVLKYKVMLRAG